MAAFGWFRSGRSAVVRWLLLMASATIAGLTIRALRQWNEQAAVYTYCILMWGAHIVMAHHVQLLWIAYKRARKAKGQANG